MRHNSNRRMKNRNNNNNGQRRGNVPPRMQVFDSNGPDVRIRGTAWQVHEKYLALAKDAAATGDVIMAENYMQHAEHYQRIINTFAEQMGGQQWAPAAADNDDTQEGEGAVQVQHGQQFNQQQTPPQQQAVNAAPRADRRDDGLGLPASLFKPTTVAPATALETA
ncbi:MAG: DUF4167 domain-containing protein [Alphaproteobacteria bacterium]|nr:DUF4167 domain-containing protein [Alphaproteobacteria bacterium]